MIQLIAGLGNPGPEYEATRHNAGFWWLETLAQQLGLLPCRLVGTVAVAPLLQMHAIMLAGCSGLHQRQPLGRGPGNIAQFG